MKTCEELKGYLAAYADDELKGDLCEQIRAHLDECERCRTECADLAKVVALYRDARPPEVTDTDWARVSAALERCMTDPRARVDKIGGRVESIWRRIGWFWPATALAAAALLVVVGLTWGPLLRSGNDGPIVKDDGTPEPAPVMVLASIDSLTIAPGYEFVLRPCVEKDDVLIIDVFNHE